jgi:hypothetical protein
MKIPACPVLKPDLIVDSVAETLFAAQIPLRCLYRDVLSLAKIAICLQYKQMKVHSTWLESM